MQCWPLALVAHGTEHVGAQDERKVGDGLRKIADLTLERFHDQLHSARFDAERADLR